MSDWRTAVCDEARTWYGTPYDPRQRIKGLGTDCGGFLYQVYEPFFGPFTPFPKDYAVDWAAHNPDELYLDFIMPYVREVEAPTVGGFSLFHVGLAYSHAAIYLGNEYIHAWGRKNAGRVTITPKRVMDALSKPDFPTKHFDPVSA